MLKRILIIFVGILLLSFWFFNVFLSHICRFGYLVHGDSYVYPHNGKSFIVPLDNGNLLIVPIYRRTDSKKSDRQVEVFKLRKGNR